MKAIGTSHAASDPQHLLLALCRRNSEPWARHQVVTVLEERESRTALLHAAEEHRIRGLLLRTLERSGVLEQASEEPRTELRSELARLERVAAFWSMERNRVQRLLGEAGLNGVVLKGAALRETIYQRPEERSVRDLDLLLPATAISAAVSILERAGYRSELPEDESAWFLAHHFHVELRHPTGFVVEIHWGLTRPSRPWLLDPVRFLDRARSVQADGVDLRVPSDEDMVLHLASQGMGDQFRQLRRLVDMDRVIAGNPDMDWDYLWSSARDGSMEIVLALALQLCRTLLGTPVPPDFLARLAPSRVAIAHLALHRPGALVLDPDPVSRPTRISLRFWLARGWQARTRLIASPLLDPNRELEALREGRDVQRQPFGILEGVRTSARYLLTLVGYQARLYARGILAVFGPAGRNELRFWRLTQSQG